MNSASCHYSNSNILVRIDGPFLSHINSQVNGNTLWGRWTCLQGTTIYTTKYSVDWPGLSIRLNGSSGNAYVNYLYGVITSSVTLPQHALPPNTPLYLNHQRRPPQLCSKAASETSSNSTKLHLSLLCSSWTPPAVPFWILPLLYI